jgi:transketolase
MTMEAKFQRDAVIDKIQEAMATDDSIFFVSADFGAPSLDRLRERFSDRFLNVGIAEQNLINIATGLALEGWNVYAYAIAPFLTMRAYEQIRTNLSILSQVRTVNVNLIGVGVGLSYDVTGPTHHCLEDACIMRVLPNLTVLSPCDHVTAEAFVDYSLRVRTPKYLRLDGKLQLPVYGDGQALNFEAGFSELRRGSGVCLVSTGHMTHKALRVADTLAIHGLRAGVIDVFVLKPVCEPMLAEALGGYAHIVTLDESFLRKGSLDTMVSDILRDSGSPAKLTRFGFTDKYVFEVGNREHLHALNGLDDDTIVSTIVRANDNPRSKP